MEPVQQPSVQMSGWRSLPRPKIYTGRVGDLRSVEEVAPVFRHIFSEFSQFNEIQSLVMDDLLYTDKSLVVSAPTGSGKTAIFELAMVRLLMNLEDANHVGDFKMIYIAPIKALCAEKFNSWKEKFDKIGVNSAEVTGDTDLRDFWDLPECNLILTTPEKWNSVTRRWRQNVQFMRLIKLVMIDEVHILNDPNRGPVLEAVVSRMRNIHRFIGGEGGGGQKTEGVAMEPMRIIALSATAPNVADLAAWVGHGNTTCFYNIAESRRPIKIDKYVLGYYCDTNTSSFCFDLNLNYKLFEIITKYSGNRPTLIFCSTRKATETATNHLVNKHPLKHSPGRADALLEIAEKVQNVELKRCLPTGFVFYHAGLSFADRSLVEESFRAGNIPVMCCTSALAMGVNLPAHLVIIKSTQMYTDYGMEEYPESSIFQMIGRAGRPQYDTFGVAVIMTQRENVQKYERLATGSTPIESYLHEHLAEHLNSEIVLQTITDLASAMVWLRSTFLYVRALSAPTRYGLPAAKDKTQIERNLEELCRTVLNALEKYSAIAIGAKDQGANGNGSRSDDDGLKLSSTLYGRLMAHYCISFQTVKLLRKIKGTETLLEMFTLLTHCQEFAVFKCRNSDKRALNELNRSASSSTIRFPLRGRIQNTTAMVSCLIQAVFGNLTIEHPSLQQEASRMIAIGRRLIRCMVEFIAMGPRVSEEEGGIYKALLSTLVLRQCLDTKLWENSPFLSKQLRGIGVVYAGLLAARGKISFQELAETNPRELEVILKKAPPFGNNLVEAVRKLPIFSIDLVLKQEYVVEVEVTQQNKSYDRQVSVRLAVLVGDTSNAVLYFKDNIEISPGSHYILQDSFKLRDATVASATGHVICLNWVGLDCSKTLVINEEAAVAVTSTTVKPRTRKAAASTKGENKKITEYYHKQDSTQIRKEAGNAVEGAQVVKPGATVEIPKVAETLKEPTKKVTASTDDTCKIVEIPRKLSLDLFQFGQKSKLSRNNSFNSTVTSDTTQLEISNKLSRKRPQNEVLRTSSERTICSKENLNNKDSGIWDVVEILPKEKSPLQEPKAMNSYFSTASTQLAASVKAVSTLSTNGTVRNSNRNLIEVLRKQPLILFGRPEDFSKLLKPPQATTMRRVCIFGVLSEVSRDYGRSTVAGSAPRSVVMINGGGGVKKDTDRCCPQIEVVQDEGQTKKELDLGIDKFLDSPEATHRNGSHPLESASIQHIEPKQPIIVID